MTVNIINGDCRAILPTLESDSIYSILTSQPYWGLRDYGGEGQIGVVPTLDAYVETMAALGDELWRVLKPQGTFFLNLGDSYSMSTKGSSGKGDKQVSNAGTILADRRWAIQHGLKPKDLCGVPWSVAKALQAPRYTGKIKAERDRVWLAAIIDGEGTICGTSHLRSDDGRVRTSARVFITNSCDLMLNEANRIWPASRHEHCAPGDGHFGTKEVNRWIASSADGQAQLLAELYPYFVSKKQQALVGWNLLQFQRDGRRLGQSGLAAEVREKRELLCSVLSDLNHARPVVIPDWLKEPPDLHKPGWWLRSAIVWAKPNPMPESVTDRPTSAYEMVFLLTKAERYFYDADAIAEKAFQPVGELATASCRFSQHNLAEIGQNQSNSSSLGANHGASTRNARNVWAIATQPFKGSHFATMPPDLAERCIKAGCPRDGHVLDPFGGAGTTGLVADRLGRNATLIELNPAYRDMASNRVQDDSPLFANVVA